MRVLSSIVQETSLGDLVDKEPEDYAGNNALVQGVADHVKRLVVDPVHLLQALQVIFLRGCVGNCPESEIVHVAKKIPVVFKGNSKSLLLQVAMPIREFALGNVV